MKVNYNVFGLRRGFDSSGRELLEWELLAKNNQNFQRRRMDENNNPAGSLCWTVPIGEVSLKPAIGIEETMSELESEPDSLFEKRFRDVEQAGLLFSWWLGDTWGKSQELPYCT